MRSLYSSLSPWFLLLTMLPDIKGRLYGARYLRELETELAPMRWDYCVEAKLTGEECKEYILDTMPGRDITNHPFPHLSLTIEQASEARATEIANNAVYNVGIPLTIEGEVDCDLDKGIIRFPFPWEASDGNTYTIPDVLCTGLEGQACCNQVMKMMDEQGIPKVNKHGNCFSCRLTQVPLIPQLNEENGLAHYISHSYNLATQTCERKHLTLADVRALDATMDSNIDQMRFRIRNINKRRIIPCGELEGVKRYIQEWGRVQNDIATTSSDLFCDMVCPAKNPELPYELSEQIQEVLWEIHLDSRRSFNSASFEIVVHTDVSGLQVTSIPQVGGSRASHPELPGIVPSQYPCELPKSIDNTGQCLCPVVTTAQDTQAYWGGEHGDGSYRARNTESNAWCGGCPAGTSEFDHTCICPDGFMIYDTESHQCVCPFGVNEDGSCHCPGPYNNVSWNQVGWIPDGKGSCTMDSGCTRQISITGYEIFSTFADGCNACSGQKSYFEAEKGCAYFRIELVPLKPMYYTYEVVVNYLGEVLGDNLDGQITYDNGLPGTLKNEWFGIKAASGDLDNIWKFGPVDCLMLRPYGCQRKFMSQPHHKEIDFNGNTLSLIVKQQEPLPYGTEGKYCTWVQIFGRQGYRAVEVSMTEMREQWGKRKRELFRIWHILDYTTYPEEMDLNGVKNFLDFMYRETASIPEAQVVCAKLYSSVMRAKKRVPKCSRCRERKAIVPSTAVEPFYASLKVIVGEYLSKFYPPMDGEDIRQAYDRSPRTNGDYVPAEADPNAPPCIPGTSRRV